MIDSIYHVTFKLLIFYLSRDIKLLINCIFGVKTSKVCHLLRNVIMDVITQRH